VSSLRQDLRYAVRSLSQSRGFTAVVLLSLALGIGANTTIFSVINAVLYRPLPFEDSDRLVLVSEYNLQQTGWERSPTLATLLDWQQQARSFERIAGVVWYLEGTNVSSGEGGERVSMQFVTPGALSLLGVTPALGRPFTDEDADPAHRTVIISHGLWQRRFGGAPDVIGRSLQLQGQSATIIGVMPRGFWVAPWTQEADLWFSLDLGTNELSPDTRWPMAYARLAPGATLAQAQAEMDVFARRMAETRPGEYEGWGVRVEPLHEAYFQGRQKTTLFTLLAAVGFVLLIACANVANLLLARSARREKEIAIRGSLGAGRRRLVQQLLTESLLLGLLGGIAGIFVGWAGIRIFLALAPDWFPRAQEIAIDPRVLVFTLAVSLLAGLLFGLAPAVRTSRPDLAEALKEGARRSTRGPRQRGSRVLAVSEVALAFVLLIGAGLMMNTVIRLEHVDLGYDPGHLLVGEIELLSSKYREMLGNDMKRVTPQAGFFYDRVLEGVETLPGTRSAALVSAPWPFPFRVVGAPEPPPDQQLRASLMEVSSGYFETLGVPLRKGRLLNERDREGSPWVVVVNEAFVRRFSSDMEPLGRSVQVELGSSAGLDRDEEQRRTIVGVVGDVRHWGPRRDPPPAMYISDRQHPWEYPSGDSRIHLRKSLIVRTASEPLALASAVRKVVTKVDSDQLVYDLMTEKQRISGSIGPWRFFAKLYGLFAGMAILLALVGVYGVMSYSVGQRSHEFGIRMALGARKRDVMRQVLSEGVLMSSIGVGVGLAAALGLTRFLASLLFEVKPYDPLTFAAISLVMLLVGLLACCVPARRATTLDPVAALRHE
jgi:putative ABC transport system permease protein